MTSIPRPLREAELVDSMKVRAFTIPREAESWAFTEGSEPLNKLLTIENALDATVLVLTLAVALILGTNGQINRERIITLERHDHRMDHNHTDDDMARQYGRVRTGVPDYLAGIGGWY